MPDRLTNAELAELRALTQDATPEAIAEAERRALSVRAATLRERARYAALLDEVEAARQAERARAKFAVVEASAAAMGIAPPSPLPAVVDKAIEARELASALVGLLIEAADEMKGPSCDRTVQHLSERIGVAVARANTLGIGPTHKGEGDIEAGELVHRLAVALKDLRDTFASTCEWPVVVRADAALDEARKAGALP
jgi:hypothetical protein